MTKLFTDREFEAMDWLSKTIQPYTCSLNNIIEKIPDEVFLSEREILDLARRTGQYNFSAIDLMRLLNIFSDNDYNIISKYMASSLINDILEITPIDNDSIDTPFCVLKKNKQFLKDEDLLHFVSSRLGTIARIYQHGWHNRENKNRRKKRIGEILGIIGLAKKEIPRGIYAIEDKIFDELRTLILDNKWNIRNIDLMMNMVNWIFEYIENENLAALRNVTILKCMTHSGNPIYSMEEA